MLMLQVPELQADYALGNDYGLPTLVVVSKPVLETSWLQGSADMDLLARVLCWNCR